MADKEKIVCVLQTIVTALAQQADGHVIQAKIFGSQGFSKLEEKYMEHAEEERGWVSKCIDRLLDLEVTPKLEAKKESPVCTDPVDWLKFDLQVSIDGLAVLKQWMDIAKDDVTTYDILKDYYKDEEEDMYWGQQQLDLIKLIGKENWLTKQL